MRRQSSSSAPIKSTGKDGEMRGGTDRVLALLSYVAKAHEPVSMKSIIDDLELPKPTAHRLVSSLEEKGYLVRSIDRRGVIVGPELRVLALDVMQASLSDIATHSVLERLSEEFGETCNIGIMSGNEVAYVDRVESAASPLRLQFRVGSRVPLHCTAIGKLLMSVQSERARDRLLGEAPLSAPTPRSLVDRDGLEIELAEIREQGYAVDDEEYILGVFCVAVPIVDKGETIAALAIQAPKVRLNRDTLNDCLPSLRRAAEQIGKMIEAEPGMEVPAASKKSDMGKRNIASIREA